MVIIKRGFYFPGAEANEVSAGFYFCLRSAQEEMSCQGRKRPNPQTFAYLLVGLVRPVENPWSRLGEIDYKHLFEGFKKSVHAYLITSRIVRPRPRAHSGFKYVSPNVLWIRHPDFDGFNMLPINRRR